MNGDKLTPYEPKEASGLQLIRDLDQSGQTYQSPTTFEWITSRKAMREDLKRSGCRQVDPGERQTFFNKE